MLLLVQVGNPHGLLLGGAACADLADFSRFGHLHGFIAIGLRHANFAEFLLLGHVAAGFLDRFRGGLASDRLDVAGTIRDIRDVDVDQHQADLLQLRFDRILNVLQKLLAVAVDVVDVHRRDHLPQLPEDDVFGLLFDVRRIEPQ